MLSQSLKVPEVTALLNTHLDLINMTKIINTQDRYYKKNTQNYHLEVILFRLLGKAKRINSKLMKLIREKDIPEDI